MKLVDPPPPIARAGAPNAATEASFGELSSTDRGHC
jgi:hypothetical protein